MQALYKLFYSFLYNIVGNQILNISAVSAFFLLPKTLAYFLSFIGIIFGINFSKK